MKQSELKRYERFYENARHLNVDDLLRRVLGLPSDFIIPMNVAHGIDFGFSLEGYDVHRQEPIYWATNERSAELARRIKPVFRAPHPFLLAAEGRTPSKGEGVLVVGPPPGLENDRNLLDIMAHSYDPVSTTILIKPHRDAANSVRFWQRAGFSTVSFRDAAGTGYDAMVDTLARYEMIVSATVSSVIFFGAALGKRIKLLRGYRCRGYEGLNVHKVINYGAIEAQRNIRRLDSSDTAEATAHAREILGIGYRVTSVEMRSQLLELIDNLTLPFYVRHRLPQFAQRMIIAGAVRAERPSLLRTSLSDFLHGRLTRNVLILDVDEVDLWLNGPSSNNPKFGKVRYIKGLREPGMAIVPYDP